MPTTANPYTDLAAVAEDADAIVQAFRHTYGYPHDDIMPPGYRKPSEGELDRTRTAANVSDAADAIIELSGRNTGMDTLARTAASTLGRILRSIGVAS